MRFALFLSRLLSFRSVALGLLLARLLKYFIFGLDGFGKHWNVTPSLGDHLSFLWNYCILPYGVWLIPAFILDHLVGQIFFREEVGELEKICSG
jgi:hypothetical protein